MYGKKAMFNKEFIMGDDLICLCYLDDEDEQVYSPLESYLGQEVYILDGIPPKQRVEGKNSLFVYIPEYDVAHWVIEDYIKVL